MSVAVLAAAVLVAGCSDDESGTVTTADGGDTTTSESTTTEATTASTEDTTTTTSNADPELVAVVEALGETVESCCGGSGDEVTFTLVSGAEAALTRSVIDPQRPEDTRRGVESPESVDTPDGGAVWIASDSREDQVLRFYCDGANYLLEMGDTSRPDALGSADAAADALGCEVPEVQAQTECLGLATDPVACTENEGAPR